MTLVYKYTAEKGRLWAVAAAEKAPDIPFFVWPDFPDSEKIRYFATWLPPKDIAVTFPNLEVLFSTGAGVDHFDFSDLPKHIKIVRMIEPGLISSMVEYACMSVLALHRDLPQYLASQAARQWKPAPIIPASHRRIGIMGLGTIGKEIAHALVPFGFTMLGWSRSKRTISGVECFAGGESLDAFLSKSDILVCVLPLTSETTNLLDERALRQLPPGAAVVNVGRGKLLNQPALLKLLDEGHLRHAFLDVCDPEPPTQSDPIWTHPKVCLTPHIAGVTQAETGVQFVIDNIRRHQKNLPLLGLVERERGY